MSVYACFQVSTGMISPLSRSILEHIKGPGIWDGYLMDRGTVLICEGSTNAELLVNLGSGDVCFHK